MNVEQFFLKMNKSARLLLNDYKQFLDEFEDHNEELGLHFGAMQDDEGRQLWNRQVCFVIARVDFILDRHFKEVEEINKEMIYEKD